MILSVLFQLQDRAKAVNDPQIYRKTLSIAKQRIVLVLFWLISLATPIILVVGIIKSYPFPDRYSCQVIISYRSDRVF